MDEEWRDIKGYEGRYQISSLGRVKSLRDNNGNYREKILSNTPRKDGYLKVDICKNGKKKPSLVHKLVAESFIPNPNNYKEINHKDENKQNNKVENLEWCTRKYNCNYGTRNKRQSEKMKGREFTKDHKNKISESHLGSKNPMYGREGSKHPNSRKVKCITTGRPFNCIKEAAEYYNICKQNISDCCRGKIKSAGKHPNTGEKLVWRYIDDK